MAAENQTRPTKASVASFLKKVDETRRADCEALAEIMSAAAKEPAVMWGPAIIGFGSVHYKYESGREGDMPLIGFSPRARDLTLYLSLGFEGSEELLAKLGKHAKKGSCLHIKRLADIDMPTLKKLAAKSVAAMRKKYGK